MGLKEGIRVFIQNQYDEVISRIGSKNKLSVEKTGEIFTINGKERKLNFNFKYENKIYGKIEYDKTNKILSISNEGEIFLSDFLLGSMKSQQENLDLIGHFGEGMKLEILAFCRKEKNVAIISSNKKYTFCLRQDKILMI